LYVRKNTGLPGSAPGGHTWTTPADVVEVDDAFGLTLLAIPDAGFCEVAPPPAALPPVEVTQEPEGAEQETTPEAEGEQPAPARAGRRKATPVSE
jgi:hypothetical protein